MPRFISLHVGMKFFLVLVFLLFKKKMKKLKGFNSGAPNGSNLIENRPRAESELNGLKKWLE